MSAVKQDIVTVNGKCFPREDTEENSGTLYSSIAPIALSFAITEQTSSFISTHFVEHLIARGVLLEEVHYFRSGLVAADNAVKSRVAGGNHHLGVVYVLREEIFIQFHSSFLIKRPDRLHEQVCPVAKISIAVFCFFRNAGPQPSVPSAGVVG